LRASILIKLGLQVK